MDFRVRNSKEWKMENRKTEHKEKPKKYDKTNAEFANDGGFIDSCTRGMVKPTPRQASKFRNKRGAAYAARNNEVETPEKV
jgi:hypothetical protein